ncbi:MAG: hypothetical protein R3C17_07635 [Planctomycetaceae bacterium]
MSKPFQIQIGSVKRMFSNPQATNSIRGDEVIHRDLTSIRNYRMLAKSSQYLQWCELSGVYRQETKPVSAS